MKTTSWVLPLVLAVIVMPVAARAGIVVFTDEAAWNAAIIAIDADAIFGGEDFNGEPVGFLGAGPNSFGGGDFSIGLNGIGNGGSMTGVVSSGDFDGSNSFQGRLVHDSSDIDIGFILLGEGAESMDFAFGAPIIGFGAQWDSVNTHDSILVNVNGVSLDLHDFLPDTNLNDGDGFFGFVDTSGISSFSMTPGQNDAVSTFEEFEIDAIQYAETNPIPDPGAGLLAFMGLGMISWFKRRS